MRACGKALLFVGVCIVIILTIRTPSLPGPVRVSSDPNPMRFDPVQKERMEKALATPISSYVYEK